MSKNVCHYFGPSKHPQGRPPTTFVVLFYLFVRLSLIVLLCWSLTNLEEKQGKDIFMWANCVWLTDLGKGSTKKKPLKVWPFSIPWSHLLGDFFSGIKTIFLDSLMNKNKIVFLEFFINLHIFLGNSAPKLASFPFF